MQQPPAARLTQPRFRVLLIEDDPDLGAALQTGLAEDRISLVIAGNAPQALEAVAQASFDLALLDLGLPGMHGLALFRTGRGGLRHQAVRAGRTARADSLQSAAATVAAGAAASQP